MQKITPYLWFDTQAEEAVNFYTSIFQDAEIGSVSRNPPGAPGPEGQVLVMTFSLNGQQFTALNGGPMFKFTEAISLMINCETQEEVDHYWEKLSEGGAKSRCGWLKDKFGLSWQVVPTILGELMSNQKQAGSVMQAMMQMDKLDIAKLKEAAAGA
jgi:predicted 3-demethylubiquinone-9 3-methyltransferase (glyoxalase superfamily)